MIPLDLIFGIGSKIIEKIWPDPATADAAKLKLIEMQQNGELAKMANETELYKTEQNNLTQRLQADTASGSWLPKNIRPLTLVFILLAYFTFAMMSAYGYNANQAYVELLGQWGMLIMSFYFGGRTLEKIMEMKSKK